MKLRLLILIVFPSALFGVVCPQLLRNQRIERTLQRLQVPSPSLSFLDSFALFFRFPAGVLPSHIEQEQRLQVLDWLESVYIESALLAQKTESSLQKTLPFRLIEILPSDCTVIGDAYCWFRYGQSPRIQQTLDQATVRLFMKRDWTGDWRSIPLAVLSRNYQRGYQFSLLDRIKSQRARSITKILEKLRALFASEIAAVDEKIATLLSSAKHSGFSGVQFAGSIGGIVDFSTDIPRSAQAPLVDRLSQLTSEQQQKLVEDWLERLRSPEFSESLLRAVEQRIGGAPSQASKGTTDWKISLAPIIVRSTDRGHIQTSSTNGLLSAPGAEAIQIMEPSRGIWTFHINMALFLLVDTLDEYNIQVTVLRGLPIWSALKQSLEKMQFISPQ